eukprot:COSAG01_NODE_1317_length_10750_cov_1.790536_6_plen_64_part_00
MSVNPARILIHIYLFLTVTPATMPSLTPKPRQQQNVTSQTKQSPFESAQSRFCGRGRCAHRSR